MRVLVLNKQWMPVNIVPWKRIFNLLCKGHAHCLDENLVQFTLEEWLDKFGYNETEGVDRNVRTVRFEIPVPDIIVLNTYSDIKVKNIRLTKKNVFLRDRYVCQYTGKRLDKKEATWDHVIPKCKGGKDKWENLVTCCPTVNSLKGDKSVEEAGLRLRKKPGPPSKHGAFFYNLEGNDVLESWKPFLMVK